MNCPIMAICFRIFKFVYIFKYIGCIIVRKNIHCQKYMSHFVFVFQQILFLPWYEYFIFLHKLSVLKTYIFWVFALIWALWLYSPKKFFLKVQKKQTCNRKQICQGYTKQFRNYFGDSGTFTFFFSNFFSKKWIVIFIILVWISPIIILLYNSHIIFTRL